MAEHSLAGGKGVHVLVVVAVDEDFLVSIVEQQIHIGGILGQALGVHLALTHHVDDGHVAIGQAAAEVGGEVLVAGDPGHAAGHGGGDGHHGVDAQLSLHAVQLFEGGLQGAVGGQGRGVDFRLGQQVLVVGQAEALDGHGEAVALAVHHEAHGGVLGELGVGHIQDVVLPHIVAAQTFDDEDVGHVAGLQGGLQGAGVVSAAADGFHRHVEAGGLGILSRVLLQRSVDFHLHVGNLDVSQRGGAHAHHHQGQNQRKEPFHQDTPPLFQSLPFRLWIRRGRKKNAIRTFCSDQGYAVSPTGDYRTLKQTTCRSLAEIT